ncbi:MULTISPECIES: glycerol kinase GlpK [unclassified Aureimonas]|uniref:glycerol kinase GlpK n=1 Tax=unclassified Aureimonas TaxID=2615206 RepID=UPI0006FABC8D|nr:MULTISPECIES: glycerol kinase GlpK [unclassified Aureimonas]KQT55340.1 glycerol kinase [Aureimonas sp. Leaf427]KQT71131.1 glycerol kinase [Aureimonas sp. Leaf460]
MSGYVLAIDQGTTSTRSIVFDDAFRIVGVGQQEFEQHFPQSGWVEHDAEEIWKTVLATIRTALADASLSAADIAAIGITNQRETTVLWDRGTGKPVHNAIVWQDRRTAPFCRKLVEDGAEAMVTAKTGLIIDPYFSGTKLRWLLDNVEGARSAAEAGKLAFGTIDSFLLWRLTGGKVHATDATNASRTMLFDIVENRWDDELLRLLDIPASLLPEVMDCAARFGETDPALLGTAIPILGMAGDQHAATVGQACFEPGMMKATYGTGCFAVLNTGSEKVVSRNRLLSTVAYRLDGVTTYALEGSIFIAGAAVQWLRDGLKIVERADATGPMAASASDAEHVYLVPAFTGLGAPWWDAEARGAIYGLTRNTGPNEVARAALEAVCFQTADLLDAMRRDGAASGRTVLRVDGGMVASDWTMQRLADILAAPVDRPVVLETTALGAAWLAGYKAGVWPDRAGFSARWQLEQRFEPKMDAVTRGTKLTGWQDAVRRTLSKPA